jgi:vacuolar-type H+-ATPase subunit E/Vma4
MKSEDENLQQLSRAILAEAQMETARLESEAQSSAATIQERAQAEAERERLSILARARLEAERLRGQAVATAQLSTRTKELARREILLRQVFAAARQQLDSIPRRKDYEKIVVELVREAVRQLKVDRAEVLTDGETRRILTTALLKNLSDELGIQLSLGAPLDKGTGVLVRTQDGHLQYDNTLETRLARLQGAVRADVFRVLMGEKA